MTTLEGRVAVVTGAASGLGEAMAHRLAAAGCALVLADVDPLDRVADAIADAGGNVAVVPTDVTDPDAVDALAAAALAKFGSIGVVCNNAGIVAGGNCWEIPRSEWRRVIEVDLMGVVNGIRSFVPHLLESGGHVVNTASMGGVVAYPMIGPYVAAKFGVVGLSEVLHHDLAAMGAPVGVSVVCPGYVPTRLGMVDRVTPPPAPAPGALSADDVAAAVIDAVLADRFYVFTHPDSTDAVARRSHAMVSGSTPVHE